MAAPFFCWVRGSSDPLPPKAAHYGTNGSTE